jgi:predicted metal-binding protein
MAEALTTVFICVSCKEAETTSEVRPGRLLFESVAAALAERGETGVVARSVECLAVCRRPCTVALAGDGKWTYVVGDLDAACSAGDVIAAALGYRASPTGIVPWRERPVSFRKGVVSRVPPLSPTDNGQVTIV